jgi:YHS domain-containing protein
MNNCRFKALLLSLASLVVLGGCGAIVAQNPSGKYSPVNAITEDNDSRVLLKGADVVPYFVDNKYSPGLQQFSSRYEDITLRFASAEHKALFDKAPTKYLPEFGGYCANGIAYGIPWGGDADTWKIIGGKLYIFGGQASKDAFELDEKRNLTLAESYWKAEVAGSNSFLQRVKRMILRVPHYQSGEDLSRAVAAAKAKAGGGKQ